MKKVVIYGAGNRLRQSIVALDYTYDIVSIVDMDPQKQGNFFEFIDYQGEEKKYLIEEFNSTYNDLLYIITIDNWSNIYAELNKKGVHNIKILSGMIDKNKESKDLEKYIVTGFREFGINRDFDEALYNTWECWDNHFIEPYIIKNFIEVSEKNNVNVLQDKKNSILDYGFGCGLLNLYLLINGYRNVFGIEVDEIKYKYLISKIENFEYPSIWEKNFILYNGDKIPYEDERFDLVISDQVLEHVKYVEGSLKEIYRVTKNNGYIYLECPNYKGYYEPHYRVDFDKSIKENISEFKKKLIKEGYNADALKTLNLIEPEDIISICERIGGIQVFDYSTIDRIKILCKKVNNKQ